MAPKQFFRIFRRFWLRICMESYVWAHKKGYYELFKNHDNPVTVSMSLEFVNLSVHCKVKRA